MDTFIDEMKKGIVRREEFAADDPFLYYAEKRSEAGKTGDLRRRGRDESARCGGEIFRGRLFCTEEFQRYLMPGVEKELEAEEFFDILADYILPFTKITKNIVISFAYRAKILPDIDCEIVEITKEVKVKNAGGKLLGREICAALAKKGADGCNIVVVNDSVATALAGKAEKLNDGYGSFTGTILGTGSNSCYIEYMRNIAKLEGGEEGLMVINTEAGSYNKVPRSDIDIAYDESTQNPGIGVFEKMTSGGYLGPLCDFTLRTAAREGVFEKDFPWQGRSRPST